MKLWNFFAFLGALLFPALSCAQDQIVIDTAEHFLQTQVLGIPGKATIRMGRVNTSRLPECSSYEAYFPPGSRIARKTYVGVRCLSPSTWSILVPAQIAVTGNYVTTTRALSAGQLLQSTDLSLLTGDLFSLPAGVIADIDSATGKVLKNSISAGQPIRDIQLQAAYVIQQGQTVRATSNGPGFSVSAEGKALSNASVGQMIQVRMASGHIVTGTAQPDGTIEISN